MNAITIQNGLLSGSVALIEVRRVFGRAPWWGKED